MGFPICGNAGGLEAKGGQQAQQNMCRVREAAGSKGRVVVGTNPPARTTPIRLLVEAKASTAFLRRARVCSQPCQRGRAGQRASRQAAGQSRAQKEEAMSVLASHRYPTVPQAQVSPWPVQS